MGITVFAILAAFEIVLTVLTCTVFREKMSWYRNRMLCNGAGCAVLVAALLLTAPENRWQLYLGLLVFGMSLVFSVISYIVKRIRHEVGGQYSGRCSKAGTVCLCALSMVLIFGSLLPAYSFVQVDGLEEAIVTGVEDMRSEFSIHDLLW